MPTRRAFTLLEVLLVLACWWSLHRWPGRRWCGFCRAASAVGGRSGPHRVGFGRLEATSRVACTCSATCRAQRVLGRVAGAPEARVGDGAEELPNSGSPADEFAFATKVYHLP